MKSENRVVEARAPIEVGGGGPRYSSRFVNRSVEARAPHALPAEEDRPILVMKETGVVQRLTPAAPIKEERLYAGRIISIQSTDVYGGNR